MGRTQQYGRFKRLTSDISHKKTWTWLRKGSFKSETESLLIAAQNAIRTIHIKARIDKTQQNSRCRLWEDRDETINHIISECSKLAQKEYKTRYNWVGKVIHWELCKKFNHTNKWYIHSPASVLKNKMHELIRDFDIHTDHLISARRPDLMIINKKKKKKKKKKRTCRIVNFAIPADHREKLKKNEKKDKYLDFARELKKTESDDYTNCNWCSWIDTRTGGLENKRTSGDHLNYCIIEIGQNTKKRPGNSRRLAVT